MHWVLLTTLIIRSIISRNILDIVPIPVYTEGLPNSRFISDLRDKNLFFNPDSDTRGDDSTSDPPSPEESVNPECEKSDARREEILVVGTQLHTLRDEINDNVPEKKGGILASLLRRVQDFFKKKK